MTKANKTYAETQKEAIGKLIENGTYDKATAHTHFDETKVTLPEGVTIETINAHISLFNDLNGQVEDAVAQQTRTAHAENDKILSTTGSLTMGNLAITSQHHLQQKIGEQVLYGGSVTAADYIYSQEANDWVATMQSNNASMAENLFK